MDEKTAGQIDVEQRERPTPPDNTLVAVKVLAASWRTTEQKFGFRLKPVNLERTYIVCGSLKTVSSKTFNVV